MAGLGAGRCRGAGSGGPVLQGEPQAPWGLSVWLLVQEVAAWATVSVLGGGRVVAGRVLGQECVQECGCSGVGGRTWGLGDPQMPAEQSGFCFRLEWAVRVLQVPACGYPLCLRPPARGGSPWAMRSPLSVAAQSPSQGIRGGRLWGWHHFSGKCEGTAPAPPRARGVGTAPAAVPRHTLGEGMCQTRAWVLLPPASRPDPLLSSSGSPGGPDRRGGPRGCPVLTGWPAAQDVRNTVGNVPLEWYDDFPHVGYDLDGRHIYKPLRTRDELDQFLDKMDDPDHW